jgi:beta-N-acetylhexosaminidase
VTLSEKIGQMLLIGFRGLEVDGRSPVVQDIRAGRIGGVLLFDHDLALGMAERNIRSAEQVKTLINSLQSFAPIPLLVAVDQEGGQVARLHEKNGFPASPSPHFLGTQNDPLLTRRHAMEMAATRAAAGFNLNFAPLVDLNVNPDNPIIGRYGRSYSADPETVSRHAQEFIAAHREQGIACTLKHFPGHGSSCQDSHLGFTDVSSTWNESELLPYRDLIDRGLADAVMTAHIFNSRLDTDYPATLSKKTIGDLLRKQLGFNGVVISDDLDMKAISDDFGRETALELAINAGNDIILLANNQTYSPDIAVQTGDTIERLASAGRISAGRIATSCRRVLNLKLRTLALKKKQI